MLSMVHYCTYSQFDTFNYTVHYSTVHNYSQLQCSSQFDTNTDIIEALQFLRVHIGGGPWVICNWGSVQCSSAPLLFVFNPRFQYSTLKSTELERTWSRQKKMNDSHDILFFLGAKEAENFAYDIDGKFKYQVRTTQQVS